MRGDFPAAGACSKPRLKALRLTRSLLMATMNMPKKEDGEAVTPLASQARLPLGRFLLQVDRQTKAAFAELGEAEKAGRDIKKAHPIVRVSIYDSKEGQQTVLD
jgi:hypothetical protein